MERLPRLLECSRGAALAADALRIAGFTLLFYESRA